MRANKAVSLIGLAEKAGKIASGEFSTEKAIKSKQANLVIIASDASDNTKKMFQNMCAYYEVPYYEFGSKEELGHGLGKGMRASLAVLEPNFSKEIKKRILESEQIDVPMNDYPLSMNNGGSRYGESQDK